MGPALLVRGELAQKNGMCVSLLQRLHEHYGSCGNSQNIVTLTTNYRCHPEILNLVGKLFYNSDLKWNDDEVCPAHHRRFKYPLIFVCSSIDEDVTSPGDSSKSEADIIVQKAIEAAKGCPSGWPKPPMPQFFVISPSEEQVILRNKFGEGNFTKILL